MPNEVYAETENYTIEWDNDIEAVVHTWTGFTSGEKFQEGANKIIDAVEEKGAAKILNDTSNINAHDDEDKAWLQEEWLPAVIDAGVEYSAQVHSESTISKMEMEGFTDDVEDLPYEPFVTASKSEAREWLAGK